VFEVDARAPARPQSSQPDAQDLALAAAIVRAVADFTRRESTAEDTDSVHEMD
jgi:hypothetical protein